MVLPGVAKYILFLLNKKIDKTGKIFAALRICTGKKLHNKAETKKGGMIFMTPKELLYIEDALGHEKYFQTKCQETASQLQDAELKACVAQMAQKHQQIFQSFYGLL